MEMHHHHHHYHQCEAMDGDGLRKGTAGHVEFYRKRMVAAKEADNNKKHVYYTKAHTHAQHLFESSPQMLLRDDMEHQLNLKKARSAVKRIKHESAETDTLRSSYTPSAHTLTSIEDQMREVKWEFDKINKQRQGIVDDTKAMILTKATVDFQKGKIDKQQFGEIRRYVNKSKPYLGYIDLPEGGRKYTFGQYISKGLITKYESIGKHYNRLYAVEKELNSSYRKRKQQFAR